MTYQTQKISQSEHDHYVAALAGEVYQSSTWAEVKNNWTHDYVAVSQGDDIKGVALILYRKIPMTNFKLAYMPRGPVCDYSQLEDFKAILEACMQAAKANNAFTLKFDPQLSRDKGQELKDYVLSIGGQHAGYEKGIKYNQPNFLMITDMEDNKDALFKRFSSGTRNKIKKGGKSGVQTLAVSDQEVPKFAKLMEITSERDDFGARQGDYFVHLLDSFGDQAQLYLTKLIIADALDLKQKELKNISKERKGIEKKLAKIGEEIGKKKDNLINSLDNIDKRESKAQAMLKDLESLQNQGETEVVLSGAIMLYFGETAYYVYAASSNDYRALMPNYQMIWTMMSDAMDRGCRYFDFGGVSGYTSENNQDDPEAGLYEFKKNFASEQLETISEFDIVLKPMVNKVFDTAMKLRKH